MTSVATDTLRDSASGALGQLQRAVAPAIKQGRRQTGMLLDQTGELIDTVTTRAGETAADLRKGIISYTKKNPLTALLLAVGAGALLISAARSMQPRR